MQSEEYIGPSRGDSQIIKEELNIVSANEEEFISETTTTTTDVNNYIIYEIQELQRFDNDLVKVEENCLPDDGSGRLETKKKRFSYEEYYEIKGNNFICLKCSNSTSFKNRIEIIYHIRRAHFGLKYISAKRKKANPDRQVLKKHFKNEHLNIDGKKRLAKPWEQCNITEIVTNKQCKQFYKAERGYFICLKCTNLKKFKCRNAIIYHIRREHFGVIFECPECKREFVNRYRLKKHFKNTHRETAGSGHEEHFNVADASAMESGADIEQPSGSTCNAENKNIFSEKMHRCSFKEYYKNDGTHFICLKCRNSPKFKYRGLIIRHIRNRHFEHNDADVKTSKRKKDWYKRYAAYNAKTKQYICLFENCKKAVSASTSFNIKRHYKLVHKIIVDTKTRYDSIEYGTKVINDTETETLAALEPEEELQRSETSFSYEQNSSTTTYADQQDEHSYKMQDNDCLKSPKKKLCYKKYAIYNEETKKCICLIESCKKEISTYSNLKRHYKLVHNIVTDEIEELLKKTDNEIEKQEELLFTDTEDHCSSSTDWHDQAASDKQVEHKSSKKKKKFCFCYKKYATYNEETRKCICLIESCKKELSNYYNLIRHYKLVHKIDIGEIEDLPKKKDIEMEKQDDNAHHAVEYEPKVINEAETESAPKNIRLEIQAEPIGDSVECEPKEINESDIELLAALDNQYVNVESDNAFENIEEELQFTDTSSSYEDHGSSSSEWYDPEASGIEVERKSSKKKKKFWYKKYAIYNEETKKCTCLIESCKKELSNYYNLIRHYKLVHKIVIGRKKVVEMEKQDDNTLNVVEYEPKVNNEAEAESAPKDIKLQIQDNPIDDSVECEPKVVNDSGIETLAVLENQYVNLESNNAIEIIKEELQLTDTSSSYEDHGSSSSECYDQEASDIEVERKSSKKKKKFCYKKYAIYNEETKKCTCLIESCKKELSNYYNLIRHYKLVHKIVIGGKKDIEMEKQDDNALHTVEYEPIVINEVETESVPKDTKLQIHENAVDDFAECEPKVINESEIETLAVIENQYVNLESNNAFEIVKEEFSYKDQCNSSTEWHDQEASAVEQKSSKKKKKFSYKKYATFNQETKKFICLIESCKRELTYDNSNLKRHYKLVHKIVIDGKETLPKKTHIEMENPDDIAYNIVDCKPKVINEAEISDPVECETQVINKPSSFSYDDHRNSSPDCHDQAPASAGIQITDKIPFHQSNKMQRGHYSKLFKTNKKKKIKKNKMKTIIKRKQEFLYKKYATCNEETKKFTCLVCKRVISAMNSNLRRHYKLVHNRVIEIEETLPKAIKNIYTRLKTTLNREEFLRCCIGLVSTENLPLRIFDDNVFFKKLLKPYEEKFETPLSSRNISNILDGSSQQILSNIANNVKNKMICLKIDIASRQDSHILALNIQYISDFKIRINTIGMIQLNETHTAQHLKEEIMKCLEEYNINIKQIYCYTTDNGTNVLRVSELLQESQNANITKTVEDDEIINSKTYDGIETLLSTVFSVVRCPAHTIQLVAYDVIGTLEAEIKNVRNIAKIIHTIVSMGNLNINLPCLDNTTKWYTTYDMILSILKLKEYINNPNKSAKISVNWIFVERFAIAFKPLAECTLNMQKQQYTFGDFFRDWLNCELDLEDIMETNSIAKALHKAMVIRKSKLLSHDAFVAALYLDPRFNFQGTPLLTNDQQKRAMNHLLKTYETVHPVSHSMSSQGENENIPIAEGSSDNTPSTSNSAYSRLLNRVNQLVNTSNSTTKPKNHDIKKELLAMCEKPMEPFETDVLKFWEQISLQNTKLTQLAEVVLAVPATQVSVERTFSAFATVLTKSRSKPSQDSIFNNLITQLNFDLLNCSELKIENNE